MRIFLPGRSARSRTATCRPRLPASMAHISPAAPAPSTSTSKRRFVSWLTSSHSRPCSADFGHRQALWWDRERQLISMQRTYLGLSDLRGLLERRDLRLGQIVRAAHLLPCSEGVAVRGIYAPDRHMHARSALHVQSEGLIRARRRGLNQIPQSNHKRTILAARYQNVVFRFSDSLIAQVMQQCKGIKGRLGDSVLRDQAVATVKGRLDDALFFKDIGE